MTSLYTQSSMNTRKTWFLMSGFLIFLILTGWVFSQAMGNSVILYCFAGFSIISSLVSYWYSDKIVLAMSNAKKIEFQDNKELYRIVENLCITAGLPRPAIYIIDDEAPNAFATGRDPEHAVVAVTLGLLEKLDRAELEGVIAHELSHIGNRDILISTIVTVMVGLIVLLADWFMRWSFFGGSRDNDNRDSRIALIITVVAIVLAILAPIFAQLMQFAISRKREFLADSTGALLTRYPEGLARALEKISGHPVSMKNTNRATAHLYIADPIKKKKKGFWSKAFMTHPPVDERLAALRGMDV